MIPHSPTTFFTTQFLPSPIHRDSNLSYLIFLGTISRITQYKDRIIDKVFQTQNLQVSLSSEYKIDEYSPDVEIRIKYREVGGEKMLTLIILVAKSVLEQEKSIVGVLGLGGEEMRVDLGQVKGLTRQFRGYWYEEGGEIVIVKPEVLIISQKEYRQVKGMLKRKRVQKEEMVNDEKQIEWRWSKVKNRKVEVGEL